MLIANSTPIAPPRTDIGHLRQDIFSEILGAVFEIVGGLKLASGHMK